jgi:hypothetical protein
VVKGGEKKGQNFLLCIFFWTADRSELEYGGDGRICGHISVSCHPAVCDSPNIALPCFVTAASRGSSFQVNLLTYLPSIMYYLITIAKTYPLWKLPSNLLHLKKCDTTRTQGFKFWKNLAQNCTKRMSHEFLNVRTRPEVLSKKNLTTLIYTCTVFLFFWV